VINNVNIQMSAEKVVKSTWIRVEYNLTEVRQLNNGKILSKLTERRLHNITCKVTLASYDNLFVTFPDVEDITTRYIVFHDYLLIKGVTKACDRASKDPEWTVFEKKEGVFVLRRIKENDES